MKTPSISQVKDQINSLIEQLMLEQIDQAQLIDQDYARLWQSIRQLISAGGKRLRPYLTYLSYTTFAIKDSPHLAHIATAQELLHFALLAHDDIIDRDLIRYGQDNIAGQYQHHYRPLSNSDQDTEHYANGAALLAGDLMISLAHQLIAQANLPHHQQSRLMATFYQSIFRVAGGELLDMEGGIHRQAEVDYFKIARYKTASYSFIGPLSIGAHLANATEEQIKSLEEFGLNLGTAYQLADDLLGVYGDQATTGKPIISDLREGKKTHFFSLLQAQASPDDATFFDQVWGHPHAQISDVERVRQIGESSGAKQAIENLISTYASQAQQALESLKLDPQQQEPYLQLIQACTKRSK